MEKFSWPPVTLNACPASQTVITHAAQPEVCPCLPFTPCVSCESVTGFRGKFTIIHLGAPGESPGAFKTWLPVPPPPRLLSCGNTLILQSSSPGTTFLFGGHAPD